jgi:hypothetical protein
LLFLRFWPCATAGLFPCVIGFEGARWWRGCWVTCRDFFRFGSGECSGVAPHLSDGSSANWTVFSKRKKLWWVTKSRFIRTTTQQSAGVTKNNDNRDGVCWILLLSSFLPLIFSGNPSCLLTPRRYDYHYKPSKRPKASSATTVTIAQVMTSTQSKYHITPMLLAMGG